MPEISEEKKYCTTTQAAKLLSVSPDTVLKWVKSGKIKSYRTLGGHYRIFVSELQVPTMRKSQSVASGWKKGTMHKYCWEYLADDGKINVECQECITYRSRAQRCYELRGLPEGLGCLRLHCESSCADCEYFKLVQGQPLKVIVLSENKKLFSSREKLESAVELDIRFSADEYDCAVMIQNFRPDHIVVDCSLGKKRTNAVCGKLFDDPRIPVPRIILASKTAKLSEYCDKEIFGWIKKPFTLQQLRECITGAM